MRILTFLPGLVVFLLTLGFALHNAEPITLTYYLGLAWRAPLIVVLLLAFCAGVAAGMLACLGRIIRLERRLRMRPEGGDDAA